MALEGVDYKQGPIAAADLIASGMSFVCRYLSYKGNPKILTSAEVADFAGNGIAIVAVFESGSEGAKQGSDKGASDARTADSELSSLGLAGAPVYFAVDFDAHVEDMPAIEGYLQGAASVLGPARIGVYGPYHVVGYALDNALARYAWQTAGFSHGKQDSRCHIYQYGFKQQLSGVEIDRDRTVSSDDDYGQAHPLLVTAVTPATGSFAGGEVVRVAGAGFSTATAVYFGSLPATGMTVVSDHEVDVTSPQANVSGGVDVTVLTGIGTTTTGDADRFTYLPPAPPVVTGVQPASGSFGGGDFVLISGSGLAAATTVAFGSVSAVIVAATPDPVAGFASPVGQDDELRVTSPPAIASGAVHVMVTSPSGTSAATSSDEFTYVG